MGSLRVALVYMSGVVAGSLGTSLSDPHTFIAGASGGVYALIAAHLVILIQNLEPWEPYLSVGLTNINLLGSNFIRLKFYYVPNY